MKTRHKVQVFCTPRSGSTLVRGILYDLFDGDVPPQSHDVELIYCERLVVTYRDFRDSAASRWRVMRGGFDSDEHARQATEDEAVEFAEEMRILAARLDDVRHNNVLYVRYEEYVDREKALTYKLAEFCKRDLAVQTMNAIAEKWTMDNVRRIAATRDGWEDFDKRYQIHGTHVHKGGVGVWRELFPAGVHERVTEILSEPLKKWGYEL